MKNVNTYVAVLFLTLFLGCDSATQRERSTIQRFRDNGFIPSGATNVYVKDNHGGFHGDGLTFLTFRSEEVPTSYWIQQAAWKPMPMEKRAQTTFDVVSEQLNVPDAYIPQMSSPSLSYFMNDRSDYREIHTGHLYLRDEQSRQYWYFNWTE